VRTRNCRYSVNGITAVWAYNPELLRHKNIRTRTGYTHVGYEQTRQTAEALQSGFGVKWWGVSSRSCGLPAASLRSRSPRMTRRLRAGSFKIVKRQPLEYNSRQISRLINC
jgi:hypothetical protein